MPVSHRSVSSVLCTALIRLSVRWALLVVALASGCHARGPNGTTQAQTAPRPGAAPGVPALPSTVAAAVTSASPARLTLAARLAQEAAQRAPGALRPEEVQGALARQGIALEGWQQVLGSTVGASFCLAGHTAQGTGVALCEFRDEAAAARGLAYSHATFDRLIPNRQLALRRGTLLTLAPPPGSALGPEEAARIQRAFASL